MNLTEGRFALLADTLYAGVLLTVAALPVVTAFAAVTAAAQALRARVHEDRPVTAAAVLGGTVSVVRARPVTLVGPPVLAAVLLADLAAVVAGMPGAGAWAAVTGVALALAAVVGLRAAVGWTPDRTWSAHLDRTARAAVRDVRGSAMLLAALVAAGTLTGAVAGSALVVAPLLAGLVVFAAVAVAER